MNRILTMLILVVAPMIAAPARAQTGREIAERVDARPTGRTTHALVRMTLVDDDGSTDVRLVEQYGIETADRLLRNVIIFHEPPSVADTRFLSVQNRGRDDDQWIYLPALRRVRRIAAGEGDSSFVGTEFTFDDLQSRDIDEWRFRLIGEDRVSVLSGGTEAPRPVYVVEASPLPGNDSSYSRVVEFVDPETWVPLRIELYDGNGDLLKINTIPRLENVQGYWTAITNRMENVQTGRATLLAVQRFEYDTSLPAELFTTNFLRTGRP